MPIVENSLYEFIRDDKTINYFEQHIQSSDKGAGKGISFEEYIKRKITKKLLIPIKSLEINESIEIWSLFSDPSKTNIPGLFDKKLEPDKIYFVDLRNQREPMFDCAFIDLIKNRMILIQITTLKPISHDIFKRDKIKEKSKEAVKYLSGKFIDENIKIDIGFFFFFLNTK